MIRALLLQTYLTVSYLVMFALLVAVCNGLRILGAPPREKILWLSAQFSAFTTAYGFLWPLTLLVATINACVRALARRRG